MRNSKKSAYIVTGEEPNVQVLLVNHKGNVLTRIPRSWPSKAEAQAEADRRNAKARR